MASASGAKTYGPPKIPDTPSHTINTMLEQRCGRVYDNPGKAAVAFFICAVFQGITVIYNTIHKDKAPSHRMWMISCGAVSAAIMLASFVVYHIIMACSFIMHGALYYGVVMLALFGIGLGVSGIVFFDKEGTGSATSSGSTSYNKKDF